MEHPALLRRRNRSDLALDLGERGAELVDVARSPAPGSSAVNSRRDTRGSMAVPARAAGRKIAPRRCRTDPRPRAGSASTHRQRSGIGCRATSGLSQPPRGTPASTTSPGAANVQAPTLERAPRPVACASSLGPGRDARELGHSARDREAELRAGTQSGVGRDRLTDVDLDAGSVPERHAGPAGERGGAVGLRSVRDDVLARPVADRHDHPRGLDADAEASEPPRADARPDRAFRNAAAPAR